ncbi:helix-turn-helix transcriptional regulator [Paenibacillus chibensis]|uniref:Helix-turn-helix transcriptional regulator n=1 Tax=Paenibacillus chibensis TaxID=59846 RepID=A0ABU6PWU4_9BACL|nr:helix-turn-helix transcriptional regulator [Paenibacillus chibensis]
MKEKRFGSIADVRIACGCSPGAAALAADISPELLIWYEANCREIPVSIALKLVKFYGISVDQVSFN